MVEMMKQFSLFSKNGEIVQSYAIQVGRIIDEHFSEAKKQTAIHDFFKKVVKKVICMLYKTLKSKGLHHLSITGQNVCF